MAIKNPPLPEDEGTGTPPETTPAAKKDTKEAKPIEALRFKAREAGSGSITGGELGSRVLHGHDIVTEDDLGAKAYAKAAKRPWFERVQIDANRKVVAIVTVLVAMLAMVAVLPTAASANPKGTNFTYAEDIGWGGAHVDELATVFGAIDTAFTGVKGGMHSPAATIAAVKAIPATGATARADNQTILVDVGPGGAGCPALYQFDAASSTAGDDNATIAPTSGTGRWKKFADWCDTTKASLLVSTATGYGASLVGLEDAAPGYFTGTTVEAALREAKILADAAMPAATLALTTTGNGASLVGIEDAAPGYLTATTVEAGIRELAMEKADAVGTSVAGNFVSFSNTTGGLADSTAKAADFATASQGGKADTALQPVVPVTAHAIATLAGTTGVLEDSQITTAMFPFIKRIRVSAPADGNAHDTLYTIPTGAVVLDAWAMVATPDADPPGLTIDFGVNANEDGFLNDVDVSGSSGGTLCVPVLDGTSNWYASTPCGDLLATLVAGTNADDRGLFDKHATPMVGGSVVAYQASAASSAVVDLYLMLFLPQ